MFLDSFQVTQLVEESISSCNHIHFVNIYQKKLNVWSATFEGGPEIPVDLDYNWNNHRSFS